MPTESQQGPQIAATLARQVERGANAAQIATAIVSIWVEIETSLTPILGQKGVAAVYKRSLYLTRQAHPWLAAVQDGTLAAADPAALNLPVLRSVLARQDSADAGAAGGALLQIFHELLVSLIGSSLTERLLRSVWANSLSGPSAQDTSS